MIRSVPIRPAVPSLFTHWRGALSVACLLAVAAVAAGAQETATITGTALDQLGARLSGTTVTLSGGPTSRESTTGSDGTYTFANVAPGRYQLVATATGFSPATSAPVYVGAGARVNVDVTLQVGPLQQAVVVTAAADELLQSQTGAPVTVIDSTIIAAQNKPDLQEALRLVPGAQVQQTGARGGQSSLFVRGGASNFTKVLVDGVSVNDIGGGFDFSQIQTTGVERIEVMRQANSVVYGSDALTGVVNIETRRGRTRIPDVGYTMDGGNLGTFRTNASIGGAVKRVDYFSEDSYFTTDNEVPNNGYRNNTYAGRFGVMLGHNTDLTATLRAIDGKFGNPNGFALYGVADDSTSDTELLYGGIRAQSQWTDRLQTAIRYGSMGQTSFFNNPTPTGQPFDPFGFGANYLGQTVTLRGANGTSVTGQGILDYGGVYPQPFESRTTRRTLFGQATYRIAGDLHLSGGGRFEKEAGYSDPDGEPDQTRNNGGVFVEGRGSIGGRTHISAGIGVEHNEAFETATTPRLSIASYLRNPARGAVGDTKLVLNFGKGIKAMSVFQQQSSLFGAARIRARCAGGGSAGAGTQHQLRRRHGTGLCRRPGARAGVLLLELLRGPDRVREQGGAAAGRRPARGCAGHRLWRLRELVVVRQPGPRNFGRGRPGRRAADGVLYLPRRRGQRVLQRRRAGAGLQPRLSRRADRTVLAAGERAPVPPADALRVIHGRLPGRTVRRGVVGVRVGPARRQHVRERRLLRLHDAAAEPGSRGGVPEGGSRGGVSRSP